MAEYNHVVEKDGDVELDEVEGALDRMDSNRKQEILVNFDVFISYLAKRIKLAESIGLTEENVAHIAQKVADYLADHEDPRNSEEKLLQELWKVGTPDEQHKLAHMLVKLAHA